MRIDEEVLLGGPEQGPVAMTGRIFCVRASHCCRSMRQLMHDFFELAYRSVNLDYLLSSWKYYLNPVFCSFFILQYIGTYQTLIQRDSCSSRLMRNPDLGPERFLDYYYLGAVTCPILIAMAHAFLNKYVTNADYYKEKWAQVVDCFETVTFILLISHVFPGLSHIEVGFFSIVSMFPIVNKRFYPHINYPVALFEIFFSVFSSSSAVATALAFFVNLLSMRWPSLSDRYTQMEISKDSFLAYAAISSMSGIVCMLGSKRGEHANKKVERWYNHIVFSVENLVNIPFQLMAVVTSFAYCGSKGETDSTYFLVPLSLAGLYSSILMYKFCKDGDRLEQTLHDASHDYNTWGNIKENISSCLEGATACVSRCISNCWNKVSDIPTIFCSSFRRDGSGGENLLGGNH